VYGDGEVVAVFEGLQETNWSLADEVRGYVEDTGTVDDGYVVVVSKSDYTGRCVRSADRY